MKTLSIALSMILSFSIGGEALAAPCGLKEQFRHRTKIAKDTYRNVPVYGGSKGLFFTGDMAVNTDGASNSYHPDDPGGNHGLAINTICNGANAILSNGKKINYKNCQSLIDAFRTAQAGDWVKRGAPKMEFFAVATRNGIPCTIQSGDYKGYFVSTTALPADTNRANCDQQRWLNALDVPFLIVPKESAFTRTGVRKGDLAAVYNPKTNVLTYAIIGDIGPNWGLAEGSVKLAKTLRQRSDNPRTRRDTYNYGVRGAKVLFFPGSGMARPFTQQTIDAAGRKALDAWGGVERFRACANSLKAL